MTRWSAFCQPPNSYTTSWDSTNSVRLNRNYRYGTWRVKTAWGGGHSDTTTAEFGSAGDNQDTGWPAGSQATMQGRRGWPPSMYQAPSTSCNEFSITRASLLIASVPGVT